MIIVYTYSIPYNGKTSCPSDALMRHITGVKIAVGTYDGFLWSRNAVLAENVAEKYKVW